MQLQEEIDFLEENLRVKTQLHALMCDELDVSRKSLSGGDPELYKSSPTLCLLLKWCKAVCAYYGMKVRSATCFCFVIYRQIATFPGAQL